MLMSDKCYERILLSLCDVSSLPSRFGHAIETVDCGEDIYELEVLDSGEETTLHATNEEAQACAQADGRAYLIHHSEPKKTFRVVDSSGNVLGDGEIYTSYNEAVIAILRECVPEWKQAVQHLKEISQPTMFTPEWEEELKKQIKIEEALTDGVTLPEEVLAANYVYRLILDAKKV